LLPPFVTYFRIHGQQAETNKNSTKSPKDLSGSLVVEHVSIGNKSVGFLAVDQEAKDPGDDDCVGGNITIRHTLEHKR
jgi:hypothetical protein